MELYIESLFGAVRSIRASPLETVLTLKARLQRTEGVPVGDQRLLWRNEELQDERRLCDYQLAAGSHLRLVLALRGGPIGSRRLPVHGASESAAAAAAAASRQPPMGSACRPVAFLLLRRSAAAASDADSESSPTGAAAVAPLQEKARLLVVRLAAWQRHRCIHAQPDPANPAPASFASAPAAAAPLLGLPAAETPGRTSPTLPPPQQPEPPAPGRCSECRRRTGPASAYACRCGQVFCSRHRNPEAHECSFDYKALGRRLLGEANPPVLAPKVQRI